MPYQCEMISESEDEAMKAMASRIHNMMMRENGHDELAALLERYRNTDIKDFLIKAIAEFEGDALFRAAKDQNGIMSVMMLIEFAKRSHELCRYITRALNHNVVDLMMHPTGSLLIVRCLEKLEYEHNTFLFDAACENFMPLSNSVIGIFPLEQCISFSRYPHRQRILNIILDHTLMLAKQLLGKSVLKTALKLGEHHFNQEVCLKLQGELETLSMNLFGRFVIELAIRSSGGHLLIRRLATFDKKQLECLSTDAYGSRVLHTALEGSKAFGCSDELVCAIKELPQGLKGNFNARKVLILAETTKKDSIDRQERKSVQSCCSNACAMFDDDQSSNDIEESVLVDVPSLCHP